MYKTKRLNLKTLLTILLASLMMLTLLFATACGNSDSTSSGSQSTSSSDDDEISFTDYQEVTNGDFEFGTTEETSYPYASSISWSRSYDSKADSADSSAYSSGIIDTTDAAYNKIAEAQAFPKLSATSSEYFNPHTPEYFGLVKDSFVRDLTKDKENKDKLPTSGDKILMIHNVMAGTSNAGRGTAQKFTSSKTISVDVDSYAKVSLWVMTKDLKTVFDTDEIGAYVRLTNTLNSNTSNYFVKNINTQGQWAQVNIFIKGSSLRSTSYRIVLGLGLGSKEVTSDYVEGFAYFDNVTSKTITKSEYDSAVGASSTEKASIYEDDLKSIKSEVNADAYTTTIEDNGTKADEYDATKKVSTFNFALSYALEPTQIGQVFSTTTNLGSKTNNDVWLGAAGVIKNGQADSKKFSEVKTLIGDSTIKNPFGEDAETLYIYHAERGSTKVTTKEFVLTHGESKLITFFAKVKAGKGQTPISISSNELSATSEVITDGNKSITTLFETSKVDDENTENWVKFYVFAQNDIGDGKTRKFNLEFNFGPTAKTVKPEELATGYALFTGFAETALTDDQYADASAGTYGTMLTLGSDLVNAGDDETTDSYNLSYSAADKLRIESGLSKSVIDYKGVSANHKMVGGTEDAFTNANSVSGIFNSEFVDNYSDFTADEKTALKALEKNTNNKFVQALAIKNTASTSYGYLGSSKTFSANTTSIVTVKLKVFGDATANIYLVNANAIENFAVLALNGSYEFQNDNVNDGKKITQSIDKQYIQTVKASDCPDGGEWLEVNFVVTTGSEAISYRVEVWNGSRDDSTKSQGLIAVEGVSISQSPDVKALINRIKATYGSDTPTETTNFMREPTLVTYTDDDGNEAEKYRQYADEVVFTKYTKAMTIIATHATVDAPNTLDETTEDTEDSTTSTDNTTPAPVGEVNWPLQITSIVITIVLIIALIVVVIKLISKGKKTNEAKINQYYNRDSREAASQKIAENKRAKAEAERIAKAKEEAEARAAAEEQARLEAEAKAKAEAEERAAIEAEAKAKAEEQARLEAEAQQQQEAENASETTEQTSTETSDSTDATEPTDNEKKD